MKSIVNAKDFYQCLKEAAKMCRKPFCETLDSVKLSFLRNKCEITATNFEQWIWMEISANGDEFDFILKDYKTVLDICKTLEGNIHISYSDEKQSMKICGEVECGTYHAVTNSNYPDFPVFDVFDSYVVDARQVYDRYNHIKFAVAKHHPRYSYMRGICFRGSYMAAMDGDRLATNRDESLTIQREFIVPPKTMLFLKDFPVGNIKMDVGAKFAAFESRNMKIASRLIEGPFYNFEQLLPREYSEEYNINVGEYLKELDLLKGFMVNERLQPVQFNKGKLSVIDTKNSYMAKVTVQGDSDIIYGYNCKYMMEILKHFKAEKTVSIRISNPYTPIILDNNCGTIVLLTTMRLSQMAA